MAPKEAPLQSISIDRTETRSLPSPHTVYAIVVVLPVRSWTVYRRYNDFFQLHASFSSAACGPPPAPLPPKHAARRTLRSITGLGGLLPAPESVREADEEQLRERRAQLETYLRAIVASTNDAWRASDEFKAFIELPKSQFVSRAHFQQGQDQQQQQQQQQRPTGAGFEDAGLSNGERKAYVPGTYARAADAGAPGGGRGSFTRTLGSAAPPRPPAPVETAATRLLDERGLLDSQKAAMNRQDSQLDDLAAILRRQKAMGLAINQELAEQSELLDDLDGEVEGTQAKMANAEGKMKKLEG
ncbi:Phox-like protein [Acaromyces ingoldii]|uniref:Phox-like protein n=1 Tax=Acaromyces ingoldii TaxID=215250 RepID=A0A316YGA0_9BASI|nr:Phox-like protein [Acaromyces ingoldii]PWN88161.1 Phox-like protein [Acaromyces ingoldii]